MGSAMSLPLPAALTLAGLWRLSFFAAVWLLLTADNGGWMIGLPAVVAATGTSLWLAPVGSFRPSLMGFARGLPFFFWHSLQGGVDVAWRTLDPERRLHPGFVCYRPRWVAGPAHQVFVNTISLLPGTLTVEIRAEEIWVHTLDVQGPLASQLEALEQRCTRLFRYVPASPGVARAPEREAARPSRSQNHRLNRQ